MTDRDGLCQATGTVEILSNLGDYLVLIDATAETSICKWDDAKSPSSRVKSPTSSAWPPPLPNATWAVRPSPLSSTAQAPSTRPCRIEDESIWEAQPCRANTSSRTSNPASTPWRSSTRAWTNQNPCPSPIQTPKRWSSTTPPSVEWDGSGPVVLTAECISCYVGLDAGYHWTVNGQPAGSNHQLRPRSKGGLHGGH